jgi:hypothetical protein
LEFRPILEEEIPLLPLAFAAKDRRTNAVRLSPATPPAIRTRFHTHPPNPRGPILKKRRAFGGLDPELLPLADYKQIHFSVYQAYL